MQANKTIKTPITSDKSNPLSKIPLFNLGFRPFFLGAGIYAVVSMLIWMAIYQFGWSLELSGLSAVTWHAHEMIYGYALAVIAGFLLTAVKNWTGVQTVYGTPLAILFSLWIAARVSFIFANGIIPAALFDSLFILGLFVSVLIPVIKSKNWKNMSIVVKLLFFGIGNSVFYLSHLGYLEDGSRIGIYIGFYMIIGLILTIARRVFPFFIERGVSQGVGNYQGYKVTLPNSKFLDIASLIVFLLFFISVLFFNQTQSNEPQAAAYFALILFIIHAIRITRWHTPGIWRKPLLWSLYISYWFLVLGFLLYFLSAYQYVSVFLAIHAFAFGGIGLITLSMMSRVSLGHTARNIHAPSKLISLAFILLICGAIVRVVLPILFAKYYLNWILLSQITWILVFALFVIVYTPILTKPRLDNAFG